MEERVLQDLGFTSAEAKVYLALLRLGPVKVGEVIEKSRLQSSTTHNTLHSLIDKGFVTYVLLGKIKIYQNVEPQLILEEFKTREQKFEEIIPRLESMQTDQKKPKAEIYEGTSGIITMLNELIKDSKPRDEYLFFAVDVRRMNPEIQTFFERYDKKRADKKLRVRGLAQKELQPLFSERRNLKVRYVDFPIPTNISICNDTMALITWGEKPVGMLVHSIQIVDSQKKFFEELWKRSKE